MRKMNNYLMVRARSNNFKEKTFLLVFPFIHMSLRRLSMYFSFACGFCFPCLRLSANPLLLISILNSIQSSNLCVSPTVSHLSVSMTASHLSVFISVLPFLCRFYISLSVWAFLPFLCCFSLSKSSLSVFSSNC